MRNLVNREKCKACNVIIVVLLCKISSFIIDDNVYRALDGNFTMRDVENYTAGYGFFSLPCGAQSNSA